MSTSSSNLRVGQPQETPKTFCRYEDTFSLTNSQLGELSSEFYEHIMSKITPRWIKVLWSFASPVLGFTLPFIIAKTDYNPLPFLSPVVVKAILALLFAASSLCCIICSVAFLFSFFIKKRKISRRQAVAWMKRRAKQYCRNQQTDLPRSPHSLQKKG